MRELIYFSSVSGNTHRLAAKLADAIPGLIARRLPLRPADDPVTPRAPYLLLTPTYGGEAGENPVPRQVVRFLNDPAHRALLEGIISCGNTNFGRTYCLAGDVIAAKTGAPHLDRVEVFGTPDDVARLARLWDPA